MTTTWFSISLSLSINKHNLPLSCLALVVCFYINSCYCCYCACYFYCSALLYDCCRCWLLLLLFFECAVIELAKSCARNLFLLFFFLLSSKITKRNNLFYFCCWNQLPASSSYSRIGIVNVSYVSIKREEEKIVARQCFYFFYNNRTRRKKKKKKRISSNLLFTAIWLETMA